MTIRNKHHEAASVRPALPGFARIRGIAVMGALAALAAAGTAFADDAFQYKITENGLEIKAGDLTKTIEAYGRMATKGMKETDIEILNIMLEESC